MSGFGNFDYNKFFTGLVQYTGFNNPIDVIKAIVDIGIVSYLIYKLILLVRETRAMQLIKGIVFILVAAKLSEWLGLRTIAFLMNYFQYILVFALVVIFQPELRRALEQLGRSRISKGKFFNFIFVEEESQNLQTTTAIEEIVKMAGELSERRIGVLIVFERETKLGEIINTGIQLNSNITSELLINIFTPNTPLHDGAVVVRDNKILAAACFLPLTDNPNISKELGTRHRAGLGITEVSDAFTLIVSEETGQISIALNGGLTRNLTTDMLRKALNKNLLKKDKISKKRPIWKVKSK